MTNTSQELTRTLKQARKAKYFDKMHDLTTFAYAWKWPRHIDWGMTSSQASDLYDRVEQLIDAMDEEGETLTACQRHMLAD